MEYNFKVGDEVITADGCVGVVKSVCDCEYCQARGFLEPEVKTKTGDYIRVTNIDKENGFCDFYKIGDYVFGNIYENGLFDRLAKLSAELKRISAQLTVIKRIREEQEQ